MTECCKNCKYYRALKHNFKQGKGFEVSHCCVIFANDDDSFVIEVGENDMCEMYSSPINESKCVYNYPSYEGR